jgi:predicted TIM-barrel fold metal-dependent hydrolase
MQLIDADSHLYEPRDMWRTYADPSDRDLALSIDDDELGWAWLTHQGRRLHEAEVPQPGHLVELGDARNAQRRHEPAPASYDELLPASYTDPDARLALLDEQGLDASVLFPNHGLVWEDQLDDLRAKQANMRAHNRWMGEVTAGSDRLVGVGHLDLSDLDWFRAELATLATHGVTLAMVGPSTVNGHSLAHPSMDPVWAALAEHNVAPVFHVGAHRRPFEAAWYDLEADPINTFTDSVLLWAAPAVALTNMAVFGVFERHPELRVGVVELTAAWIVPWLLYLDGGTGFISALLGHPPTELTMQPSEYIRRQVKVAALAYEQVGTLVEQAGEDLFMFGSDWPHAEGIADPLGTYRAANPGITGRAEEQLYGGNVTWLANLA